MDVLIINSYAGSLTIAASQLGLKIRGSYEDTGWGLPVQRANFPDLKYVERPPWPEQDLKNTVVIAHPPCAAFSNQAPGRKGIQADSFKCHRMVMHYAMKNNCNSLAIESVPGILSGASDVQKGYAKKFGYNVFWLKQNAVTFGVPQWRPRVWTVFSRKPYVSFSHNITIRTVSDILQSHGTRLEINSGIKGALRCLKEAGYSEKQVYADILSGEHTGSLLQIGKKLLGIDDPGPNHCEVRKAWHLKGRFGVKLPRVLNPEQFATTILHDSSFFVFGRELYKEEYLALMGFPTDYKFPDNTIREFRKYLSKGVCPPVAKWILQGLIFGGKVVINPNEIHDFGITRKNALQRNLF